MERLEALESGTMIMTGLDPDNPLKSIEVELSSIKASSLPNGYGSSKFSQRVIKYAFSTCGLSRHWNNLL